MPQEKGFWTTILGLNSQIDANNQVEAHQTKLLNAQHARGVITESERQRLLANAALEDVNRASAEEFFGELESRAKNPFKLVPWYAWLAVAAFAAWKLGLLKGLKR